MSFEDNGLEIYPTDSDMLEDELEFLDEKEILIDNGSDRIRVNLDKIRHSTEHLMSEENISKIINKIRDFADKVKIDKKSGIHTGSCMLAEAVSSEVLSMKPEDLGFDTKKEVQLVAEIIKASCVKDDKLEFE